MAIKERLVRTGIPILARSSSAGILGLLWLLEQFAAKTDTHKEQIRKLRRLVRDGHPAVGLIRRLFTDANERYQRALVECLGVKATWEGEQKREEFRALHGFKGPYFMVISPTMRCQLKCAGCYAGKYPKGPDPLDFATLDRVISEGKALGMHFFTISGGEPFIRPDLLDLYEKHDDCVFQIYTNGLLISDRVIERMARVGNVVPAISVEGFEEETDTRRGKGVFRKVLDTMDRLRAAGCMYGFSATMTRQTTDALLSWDFIDLMIEHGCYFGWIFMFVPVGQDDDMSLVPTPEQRDRMRVHALEIRRTRPIFVADFWNDGCLTDGCMSGGSIYLHLNYRGDVEPCVFFHFAQHNILDLYREGKGLTDALKSEFFTKIRSVNRTCKNRLRPCVFMDHNQNARECVAVPGVRPTHPGAEGVVTRLAPELEEWSARYAELADRAWSSSTYDWARDRLWLARHVDLD
jgi:MoaA/NifB/PqqE/SkfB family radical SAM enzyme